MHKNALYQDVNQLKPPMLLCEVLQHQNWFKTERISIEVLLCFNQNSIRMQTTVQVLFADVRLSE